MCYYCTHNEDDINELVKEDELDDEKLVEKTKRKRIQAQRISDWKIRQSGLFQIRKVRKNLELIAVKIRKKIRKGAQAKQKKEERLRSNFLIAGEPKGKSDSGSQTTASEETRDKSKKTGGQSR